jgi:CRISPR-associated helicase Cas3
VADAVTNSTAADRAVRLEVAEVTLEGSGETAGDLRLDRHQAELRRASDGLIFLEAPTGGGKTLACLLRMLESGADALFIYPTRELIADQEQQIKALLTHLGYAAGADDDSSDVSILRVDRPTLARLAAGRSHGEALDALLRRPRRGRLLLLTNPDCLFALLQSKYRRSGFLWGELQRFRLLVVDEVHLYWGVSLAHLCFILHLLRGVFDQVLLVSATWGDSRELFDRSLDRRGRLVAAVEGPGRTVRHRTQLELLRGRDRPLTSEHDLATATQHALALWKTAQTANAEVGVLAIVNSVIFADQLYHALQVALGPGSVAAIHGLLPETARRRAGVTVGTSAVEVGVDFDAAAGFIEARDGAAFMQRLGRIGRRRKAEVVAFLPPGSVEAFERLLGNTASVSYRELREAAAKALDPCEAHGSFVQSEEGLLAAVAFVYSVVGGLEGSKSITKARDSAREGMLQPPFWTSEEFIAAFDAWPPPVLRAMAEGGFRGHVVQVPAWFKEYGSWGELSVFDLS